MFLDLLAPHELDRLCAGVRRVFDYTRLTETLRLKLGRKLDDISPPTIGFRTVAFDVVMAAHTEGWLAEFVTAARDEFPQNARFAKLCNEILTKLEDAKQKTAEGLVEPQPPAPKMRLINFSLILLWAVYLTVWLSMLVTATAVFGLLSVILIWVATVLAQAGLRLQLIRWLDRVLCRMVDSWITLVCVGIATVGLFVASISFGSVDVRWVDAGQQVEFEFYDVKDATSGAGGTVTPVWKYRSDGKTHLRLFYLGPFGSRQLSVRRSGFQEVTLSLAPWRCVPVGAVDFRPLPYLLLIPSDSLLTQIPASEPWRLILKVEDRSHVVQNYRGQPVWIGDHSSVVPQVPQEFHNENAFQRGPPVWPEPSVRLRMKTQVQVNVEYPNDQGEWLPFPTKPGSFGGFNPAGMHDNLRKVRLTDG